MSDTDVLNGIDLNSIQNSSLISNANQTDVVLGISLEKIKTLPQVRSEQNVGFQVEKLSTEEVNDDENENVNGSLNALAQSIRERGLQNPIIVRRAHVDDDYSKPFVDDQYVVVSGERRLRATKLLKEWQDQEIAAGSFDESKEKRVTSINCIVREYQSDSDVCLDQLTENIQRVDLNNFEVAFSIKRFIDSYKNEHPDEDVGSMRSLVAKKFGKSLGWVTQMSSFSDLSPFEDQELLAYFTEGVISPATRTGYELIKLYRKHKDEVLATLNDFKVNGKVFDRGDCTRLQKFFKANSEPVAAEDLPPEPQIIEDTSNNQPGLVLASTDHDAVKVDGVDALGAEEQYNDTENSENTENEYSELNERERSATPKMFSKDQENEGPTAGINATSSYTDRDTRVAHDLSDGLERDEEREDYYGESEQYDADDAENVQSSDTDEVFLDSINCEYTDENGNVQSYTLKLHGDFSSNSEITVVGADGQEKQLPLSELKLMSFNFK